MKTLYLIGSICGITLAIIFCYEHRPYIERTAEIRELTHCITYDKESLRSCIKSYFEEYDYCGEETTIEIKPQKECPPKTWCIGEEYSTKKTYIPCYKSKLKFR